MPVVDSASLLSARQLEVLELMAKGLANREIAGVLGIAPATVKRHVSMVIEALGVTNRTEATTALHRLGLGSEQVDASEATRVPGFGGRPAIAVLPFENRSGDPDQDYFAEGFVEDLTTRLASCRWFPVISRNSAQALGARELAPAAIGRALGARYLVRGNTRLGEDRIEIEVELVDGERGETLLTGRYERDTGDLFAVQDDVIDRIVARLEPAVAEIEGIRCARRGPALMSAWECVARGQMLGWQRTRDALNQARTHFERALEIDPSFAQAATCLSGAHVGLLTLGLADDPAQQAEQALRWAERAVHLDDLDAAAHFGLSGALLVNARLAEAEVAVRRALELDPSFARAYWGLSIAKRDPEHAHEAVELLERAIRLSPHDPLLPEFRTFLASAHFVLGDDAAARAEAERALEAHADSPFAQGLVAASAAHLGHAADARAALDALLTLDPTHQPDALRLMHPAPLVDRYAAGLRKAGFEG